MADYLLTINSVRDKSTPVFDLVFTDELTNFDSHFADKSKLDACLNYIVKLIKRDFGTDYTSIPPHGRWQHLEAGGKPRVHNLIDKWQAEKLDTLEITRRLIDLFVISVFLDAGAGNVWKYKEPSTGDLYNRSEGLAVASYYVFIDGEFSNDAKQPYQVNANKMSDITEEKFKEWLQVTENNGLSGFDGRLSLLKSLGKALANDQIFGGPAYYQKDPLHLSANNRPGNIVDYLIHLSTTKKSGDSYEIDLSDLWNALMSGFNSIWQSRLELDGKSLGDAWYSKSAEKLAAKKNPQVSVADKIVPFHKLTQWLCYSLLIPLKNYGNFIVNNESLLTGLPEYRNGGLLIDFGLLTIKPEIYAKGIELTKETSKESNSAIPTYKPDDDLIVEWRSCTVGFLDYILPLVNEKLNVADTKNALKLPQLIEAGSWKAGREIAAEKRPATSGPPINLLSDGTVF